MMTTLATNKNSSKKKAPAKPPSTPFPLVNEVILEVFEAREKKIVKTVRFLDLV
jgi:hypothetical protein